MDVNITVFKKEPHLPFWPLEMGEATVSKEPSLIAWPYNIKATVLHETKIAML